MLYPATVERMRRREVECLSRIWSSAEGLIAVRKLDFDGADFGAIVSPESRVCHPEETVAAVVGVL